MNELATPSIHSGAMQHDQFLTVAAVQIVQNNL
jgi:hypothetical protein